MNRCARSAPAVRVARAVLLACLIAPGAHAGNGLLLTGYGTESSGMGGADVAVARDSLAINTNPAGLGQIPRQAFDFYVTPYYDWNGHADSYGNDQLVSNQFGAIFGTAYARPVENTPLVAAIGLFVQGGIGYHYTGLETAFGTRDEASSMFSVAKLAPALAWRVNDRLSLGLNAGLVYASLSEALFPDTSVMNAQDPAASFYGLRLHGASGLSYSGRIGLQYRAGDALSLALSYAGKTRLPMSGGRLSFNESAAGLGTVTYGDTRIEGLALPQEVAAGLAYRPDGRWLLSAEVKWLDWSGALRSLSLDARGPDNSGVPAALNLPTRLGFRDQYVAALGMAYRYSDRTTLRAGFNYARRPIPEQNLSPTFAPISAPHVMAGLSRRLGAQWELGSAVEYEPTQTVTYTNPAQPFGANARERLTAVLLHLMISRRW
jgi:long-chain fatty acid transport protein